MLIFSIFRPVTSRPTGKYEAAFQEAFERKLSERSVRLNAACQKYGDLLHWQAGGHATLITHEYYTDKKEKKIFPHI